MEGPSASASPRSIASTEAGPRLIDRPGPPLDPFESELAALTEPGVIAAGVVRINSLEHVSEPTIPRPALRPVVAAFPAFDLKIFDANPAACLLQQLRRDQ